MVTRGELRDAVTTELKAISGNYDVTDEGGTVVDTITLESSAIGLQDPSEEILPSVIYYDNYVPIAYNGVGTAPQDVILHDDGTVNYEEYYEYIEAQFIIDVRAPYDYAKEPIYEALRRRFGKYQFGPWGTTDLHADVRDIRIEDATDIDTGDTEEVIRGDQLEVYIEFWRGYEHTTDNIESVDTNVDSDADGTIDDSYTTI